MVLKMAVEMIRQGLIILDVEDSKYDSKTCQLTLTAMVINPKPTAKRLYIEKSVNE